MNEITTVGLDLAKRVVSLCAEDATGRVVLQRTLRREAVLGWFAQRPACLVGMEACSSAHWFARELVGLGHTARIIAPEFVRPFRLSGKNDANDAQAICAAVRQRFDHPTLALVLDITALRGVPAGFERRGDVSDYRCNVCRGAALLHSQSRCRGGRALE